MSDSTRKILRLDPGVETTWCANGHDVIEIELARAAGMNELRGDCSRCDRRFVSKIEPRPFPSSE